MSLFKVICKNAFYLSAIKIILFARKRKITVIKALDTSNHAMQSKKASNSI